MRRDKRVFLEATIIGKNGAYCKWLRIISAIYPWINPKYPYRQKLKE